MEVHHHSHTSRKKWTHYFWEFLMLFLAVFCGFLAEYQLEHKIEHDREKQFIRSMVEDLAADTATLTETAFELQKNVARMDSLKLLLCSDDLINHTADVYYLGRRASRGVWLTLHDRTIQQMKNSGAFRLIRNEKVSAGIIEYYTLFNFISRLENIDLSEVDKYRELAVHVFNPLIFDGLVDSKNNVRKPDGNPPLLTYDKEVILKMAGYVSYSKNSRLALAKAELDMKQTAIDLIKLILKEYHLK